MTTTSPSHECSVCTMAYPVTSGIQTCPEHFYCNDCAVETLHRSLRDNNEFPASCCSNTRHGFDPILFEGLLGPQFVQRYYARLHEYNTPIAERRYCANPHCAEYKHPRDFVVSGGNPSYIIAHCDCGTVTCTKCKKPFSEPHSCRPTLQLAIRPDWVPEYSRQCRIKQCPQCKEWIELSEACNHMTCTSCQHQFCFVCLMPWRGFHDRRGCPMYGDPAGWYDDEGFENTGRGLHLYTGRDREGYNARGMDEQGLTRDGTPGDDEDDEDDGMPGLQEAHPQDGMAQLQEEVGRHGDLFGEFQTAVIDDRTIRNNFLGLFNNLQLVAAAGDGLVYIRHLNIADEAGQHQDQGQGEEEHRPQDDQYSDHPSEEDLFFNTYPPPSPTLMQLECHPHPWNRFECGARRYTQCQRCAISLEEYFFRCDDCHVVVCGDCRQGVVRDRDVEVESLVVPILWAEQGFEPFRAPVADDVQEEQIQVEQV